MKKGKLYVIRETSMPAVLLEGGFISNPTERVSLKSIEYQEKIARGVADGVDYYFKKLKKWFRRRIAGFRLSMKSSMLIAHGLEVFFVPSMSLSFIP